MDKNTFVTKAIFVEKDFVQNNNKGKRDSLRRSKNSFFFLKKGISKKKKKQIRKMIKELFFLFRCQITEIQKIYSWKGPNKCFLCQKKGHVCLV